MKMKVNVTHLKCDNPDCDYKHEIEKGESLENLVGVECPDCGLSILTQQDYDNQKSLELACTIIEKVGFARAKLMAESILLLHDAQEKSELLREATNNTKSLSVDFNTHGTSSIAKYNIIDTPNNKNVNKI